MSTVSLGEAKWRLLRRLHLAGGSARWAEVRRWGRKESDERHRDELAAAGLVTVRGDTLTLTEAGQKAQVLGEVEV